MLRRISGKRKDKTIKYLVTDSDTITNKTDIAETLATSFAAKSSPDHYQEKIRKIMDKEKENTLDFESDNDEKYNGNFSKRELIKSIAQATDSATGPDEIHYQFLKHLPDVSLDLLLLLLNDLWQSQDFPDGWREATVIPIPKPGKDRTDPNNYRPIALTSCLCKIMERMINHRLTWFLQVRLDNTHSSLNPQEEGVPQGSILSPTLFTVKINSIIDALPDDIEKSLYVDDLAVYCQSSNMAIIQRRLQGCLDKLVTCADENGFKFSPTKTLCVHFCKKMAYSLSPISNYMDNSFLLKSRSNFLVFFSTRSSVLLHTSNI